MSQAMSCGGQAIGFGPYYLIPEQQLLLEADKPLHLGSRALGILIVLVERAGDLVSKEELLARVWPGTFVEEGTLRVHIAALRRALGDGKGGKRFVANVSGRGYRFVAPISLLSIGPPVEALPAAGDAAGNLPAPLSRMVGRSEIVRSLLDQLATRRFITITGPGGIGKTTVALAVANELAMASKKEVRYIDLTPVADPRHVPAALASVLGMAVHSGDPFPSLIAVLREREMLLVLDGCEHVVEAAARLGEAVYQGAPLLQILATSRERLRAEGEAVVRLGPLDVPPDSAAASAGAILAYPAAQLFVERAVACRDDFELTDANAGVVADICRRLDGIALAIELAAGRIDAFGVQGLASQLDDRFDILTRGRRAALPRHQTMLATLDWSYDLLTESERMILRRAGIFTGWFATEAAIAVLTGPLMSPSEVVGGLADLVTKSLIVADVGGAIIYYRLFDTTRAYALKKFAEDDEAEAVLLLYAEHYRNILEKAEQELETRPAADWVAKYRCRIDDVRAALDWAFAPTGNAKIGVALTEAAVPLWMQMSLIEECRVRATISLQAGAARSERHEMRLQAALGWSLMQTRGSIPDTYRAWNQVLEIATNLGDTEYKWRANWGLWVYHFNGGEFRTALRMAREAHEIAAARADANGLFVAERMTGSSLHYLGDQVGARAHMERVLDHYGPAREGSRDIRFVLDPRASARSYLARILWLQGYPEQAFRNALLAIEDAEATGHALSLCNALVQAACPLSFLVGDLAAAEGFVARLLECAEKHALTPWYKWGRCFEGMLLLQRGETGKGLALLDTTIADLPSTGYAVYRTAFLGMLAEAVGNAGQPAKGLAAIDEAIRECQKSEELWCIAELTRVKGELLLQESGATAFAVAEENFRASLASGRQQHALGWQLRTATSLACLMRMQNRTDEARDLLDSVYAKFTEGFETADLKSARALLDELT